MDDIKIISEKTVLKGRLFEVKEIKTKFDDKERKHYDVIRKPTVSIFPLTDSYEIYLISQYRYLHQKTIIEATARFIDDGETAIDSAKRELKEETGIIASKWEEIAIVEMAASAVKATSHVFLARDLKLGKAEPEEGEKIKLITIPLDEAVKRVLTGEINVSISMIGILLLDKLRKENKL